MKVYDLYRILNFLDSKNYLFCFRDFWHIKLKFRSRI